VTHGPSPTAQQPLQIAVIGAGAFGRNHIRLYSDLAAAAPASLALAAVVESDPARAAQIQADFDVLVISSLDHLLAHILTGTLRIDAASICVPTVHHAAVARQLLCAGVDLLIEKPFTATLAEADELIALSASLGRIVQVGHLERFNPAVTILAPHLNGPMFFEAHRLSIFTPRSLDVDVVLDLMIHDLDIVLHLAQSPVREVRAVGLPVLSQKVDIANVRVEFDSGCIANFTASRVSTERVRKLRFFQPHQYVSLDYARQEALFINLAAGANPAAAANALKDSASNVPKDLDPTMPQHPSAGLAFQRLEVTPGEPLRFELESFLDCVRTRRTPRVSALDGRAALDLALEINAVIAAHAKRAGLDRYR
jgi:predicted dehydrogenase